VDVTTATYDSTLTSFSLSPALKWTNAVVTRPTKTQGLRVAPAATVGSFFWGGKTYTPTSISFAGLSDHSFSGIHALLEAQFNFQSAAGERVTVSVFYKEGSTSNPFLSQFSSLHTSTCITTDNFSGTVASVDFGSAFMGSTYYYYEGSVTTPPCSIPVKWILLEQVQTATGQQIQAISDCLADSAFRPTQALNGRTITTNSQTAYYATPSTTTTTTSKPALGVNLNFGSFYTSPSA